MEKYGSQSSGLATGYHIRDIEFSAAFDIDVNKAGKDLRRR